MAGVLVVVGMLAAGAVTPAPQAAAETAEPAPTCQRMSLRQRAAQTVMTGLPTTRATAETIRLVEHHAGTVILLGNNIASSDQLRRLTRALRRHAPHGMLVAVDEEGGRVSRLGSRGIVDKLPSARTLARTKTPQQIRRLGARLGRQMAAVGMNWNFAPVLDVADAQANTVIGDRSYSGDPDVVAAAGRAFAAGLRSEGIRTSGKHFPGHGRTTVDSHDRLPTVRASRAQLLRRDVRPFAAALPELDSVMTAHVRYTALDAKRPASLSRAATRLLRHDLGYRGVMVTDSLVMGAITQDRTVIQAAEQALRAGADIALVPDWNATPRVTTRIVKAVRAGRLSRRSLDRSVARVLTLKGFGTKRIDCLLGR